MLAQELDDTAPPGAGEGEGEEDKDDTVEEAAYGYYRGTRDRATHIEFQRREGSWPALESSHAVAQALKEAPRLGRGKVLVVCLSGRGDKDAYEVARLRGEPMG